MQYMKDSSTANVLRQFWERLPRCLRSKWTEIARLGVTRDRQPTSTTSASLCPNKPIWWQMQSAQRKNSHPIIFSLCPKIYHPDECTQFLKNPYKSEETLLHSKVYALVVIVLSRKSCQIHDKKHSTSLDDHNWRLEEVKTEGRSSQHEKPAKGKGKSKSMCAPPFAVWPRLVTFQSLRV